MQNKITKTNQLVVCTVYVKMKAKQNQATTIAIITNSTIDNNSFCDFHVLTQHSHKVLRTK